MKLDLTPAAIEDLRAISQYTFDQWGPRHEESYLNEIWRRFKLIRSNPTKFRYRHDLFPQCQIASQGKHVILFRIQKEVIQVARVLHSSMDFKRHLPD